MTYLMSPSNRALLPRREVAVTVTYWHARDDAKNSSFFSLGARGGGSAIHPADALVGTGRVGRGLGKGGGVLLARATAASCLVEDTRCQDDGNCIIVASIFDGCGTFFTPRERQTPGFRDVVARANDTPVPLRRQNRDKALRAWRIIAHRGRY